MKYSVSDKIIEKLCKSGYDAYLVGGCVRDFLRNETPYDFDICTSATPLEIEKCFEGEKIIETGLKHGTVTLISDYTQFEITTFRADGGYDDSRHPKSVKFVRTLEEDLARRDFTINAIAMKNGEVFDFFGGKADLSNKIIRAVGEPNIRFCEDALRILRALRFASCFCFDIEENTKKAIFKNKDLLKNISAERIASEFNKLILGQGVEKVLTEYYEVIAVFIPEILPAIGFEQHNPFHLYDVYTHTVKAVACADKILPVRLAMFFHDIAKPQCFSSDDNGTGHFYSHAEKSAQTAKTVLQRLKYDRKTVFLVYSLVLNHYSKIECNEVSVKHFIKNSGADNFILLLSVMRADNFAKSLAALAKIDTIDKMEELVNHIIKNGDCYNLWGLAVNGSDLVQLGYKGSEIGEKLNKILDEVIDGKLINDKNAIFRFLQNAGH